MFDAVFCVTRLSLGRKGEMEASLAPVETQLVPVGFKFAIHALNRVLKNTAFSTAHSYYAQKLLSSVKRACLVLSTRICKEKAQALLLRYTY